MYTLYTIASLARSRVELIMGNFDKAKEAAFIKSGIKVTLTL